jgi:hypothetical protein
VLPISNVNVFSILEDYEAVGSKGIGKDVKILCGTDLALFARTFFPTVFTSEFCSFHKEVFHALEEQTLKFKDKKYYFVRQHHVVMVSHRSYPSFIRYGVSAMDMLRTY